MDQPRLHETLSHQLFTEGYLTTTQISECGTMANAGPILAALMANQRAELRALANGQWGGDLDEVAGLRALGLQDSALGVTPLGGLLVAILEQAWDHPARVQAGV